jgi:hypothetical protein
MSRLAAIGGMQGSVTEAEEEKCSECGKVHEGDCAVEEAKKPDADKDGIPDWADKDKEKVEEAKKPDDDNDGVPNWADKDKGEDDNKEVKESDALATMRKLAGITECGEEYADMSPMSVTGTEEPGMGVPAQVMSMDAEPSIEGDATPKAKYTLSIQNGENNLSMTTDMPDEIIHIMKLAGVNKGAEVTKTEAPESGEEQSEAPKKEVEEDWGNTPSQTSAREPKAFGDIRDWGQKGTGKGQADSASRKPFGQGDNPLGEQAMMESYKKFKAGK